MFQAFKQVPSTSCTTPFWFKAASLLPGHGSVLHSSFSCITAFSKSSVYWYFAERFLSSIRKTCSTTLCLLSICPKIKQAEKCLKSVGIPRQQVFSLTSELLSLSRAEQLIISCVVSGVSLIPQVKQIPYGGLCQCLEAGLS